MTRRAKSVKHTIVASILVILVAALFGLTVAAQGAKSAGAPARGGSGHLSILDRPATAGDVLPASVLNSPMVTHLASVSAVRLAGSFAGNNVYVGPGTKNTICLIVTNPVETYGDCAGRDLLNTGAIYLSRLEPDGTTNVFGVVDDSRTAAISGSAQASVGNNVFELPNVSGNSISLSGPDGAVHTVDLGRQAPTSG